MVWSRVETNCLDITGPMGLSHGTAKPRGSRCTCWNVLRELARIKDTTDSNGGDNAGACLEAWPSASPKQPFWRKRDEGPGASYSAAEHGASRTRL